MEDYLLRNLISEHGAAFHLYIESLKSSSALFHLRDYHRAELDKTMEAVLQYLHDHYSRKVNTNDN